MSIALLVGSGCVLVLLAGWIGYPLWLAFKANRTSAVAPPLERADRPPVTVLVATRERPELVSARVSNLLASNYPAELLEIVVSVDYAAEFPIVDYERLIAGRARIVRGRAPGGKAQALNMGVQVARGAMIVFADSAQTFESDTIGELISELADARIGAVSGHLTFGARTSSSEPLNRFWSYEIELRRRESIVHSLVAVTGAVYAMRRELWIDLPAGLICDDLFVPLSIVRQGYRVAWREKARAHDPRVFSRRQEFARKVRTLTGMLQYCLLEPRCLSPRQNPIWLQFVCHKLLRIATPFLFSGVLLSAVALLIDLNVIGMSLAVAVASVGVGVALLSVAHQGLRGVITNVGWMVALLYAPVFATIYALRGKWDVWVQQR